MCNSVLLAQCRKEKWLRHLTGDITTFREDTNSSLVKYIMQMSIVPIYSTMIGVNGCVVEMAREHTPSPPLPTQYYGK